MARRKVGVIEDELGADGYDKCLARPGEKWRPDCK